MTVDRKMMMLKEGECDFKREMAEVLNARALSGGKNTTLDIAISNYVRSVICRLNGEDRELLFPEGITFVDGS